MITIKQPNGLYAIYSYDNDSIKINMTEEDYINYRLDLIKKELKNANLASIAEILEYSDISDKDLKSMGFTNTKKEALLHIPKAPKNTTYVDFDFCTYGKCPTCGNRVEDGIGNTDKKCPNCGQMLDWSK